MAWLLSPALLDLGDGRTLYLFEAGACRPGRGSDYVVSFVIVFSMSQTIGRAAGSAVLGTYQQFRQHAHSFAIDAGVDPTQGVVAQRLQAHGQIYAGTIMDPSLRKAQGTARLAQIATREENVGAYNDVFILLGLMALAFLV